MLKGVALHLTQPVGMGLSLGDCGRDVRMCHDPRNRGMLSHGRETERWGNGERRWGISAWDRGRLGAGEP